MKTPLAVAFKPIAHVIKLDTTIDEIIFIGILNMKKL
jgi:hypothetical protein